MLNKNYNKVIDSIPNNVTLIVVSKNQPISKIKEIYDLGHRHFGENRVQELIDKKESLPKDIFWHLIGHLQTNKVKYLIDFVHLIHSVDSIKLLSEINKEAKKKNKVINCLLQIYIAEEESKFGFSFDEIKELFESSEFLNFQHVNIIGVMGMASNTDNEEKIKSEFQELMNHFHVIKSHYFKFNSDFNIISMGMSSDYLLAIEQGSTMIRVGSSIFKEN